MSAVPGNYSMLCANCQTSLCWWYAFAFPMAVSNLTHVANLHALWCVVQARHDVMDGHNDTKKHQDKQVHQPKCVVTVYTKTECIYVCQLRSVIRGKNLTRESLRLILNHKFQLQKQTERVVPLHCLDWYRGYMNMNTRTCTHNTRMQLEIVAYENIDTM